MNSTKAAPAESSSASRTVRFEDPRSPVEIRSLLERRLMTPFDPDVPGGRLEYRAAAKCNGLPCRFRLVYFSAEEGRNAYALDLDMSWDHTGGEYHEYYGKSSSSWFDLWTAGFEDLAAAETAFAPSAAYRARVEEALAAEWMLTDAAAVQKEILAALRNGATFAAGHKEGGTRIGFEGGSFYRNDHGESDARETFAKEAEFLAFLRRFFDLETSRAAGPDKFPEEVVWRLILRLLHP